MNRIKQRIKLGMNIQKKKNNLDFKFLKNNTKNSGMKFPLTHNPQNNSEIPIGFR